MKSKDLRQLAEIVREAKRKAIDNMEDFEPSLASELDSAAAEADLSEQWENHGADE